jgi:hypothetical protein
MILRWEISGIIGVSLNAVTNIFIRERQEMLHIKKRKHVTEAQIGMILSKPMTATRS